MTCESPVPDDFRIRTTGGYGLLRVLHPAVGYAVADRIAGALTGYACGDALGLPYENLPSAATATVEEIEALCPRGVWQPGDTSDDTALTLLAAGCLVDAGGAGDAPAFLRALAARQPPVRGLGPSTTAALEAFRRTGQVPTDTSGGTNGAAMRALPVGWAVPISDPTRLCQLTVELSRATHRDPEALVAACVVAAGGSRTRWPFSPRVRGRPRRAG